MKSVEVRQELVDALRLDLIGPCPVRNLGSPEEVLPQAPARWYLTGFLVPLDAGEAQRVETEATEEVDAMDEAGGTDDAATPEPVAARQRYLSSSIGMSLLVQPTTQHLDVVVRWGDYLRQEVSDGEDGYATWKRVPRKAALSVELPEEAGQPLELQVPNSRGLRLVVSVRQVAGQGGEVGVPPSTRCVSLFLVNRRPPSPDEVRDEAFVFQAEFEVVTSEPLVPRPNLRSLESEEWDERVADLQYRSAYEFAVGHSVATDADVEDGQCRRVRTCWIPQAEVERVAPAPIEGVELSMDALSQLTSRDDAKAKLQGFVTQYRGWIDAQQATVPTTPKTRQETGTELLTRARVAADRIEKGIALLGQPDVLEAFRVTNRVMASAARRRFGVIQGLDPQTVKPQ